MPKGVPKKKVAQGRLRTLGDGMIRIQAEGPSVNRLYGASETLFVGSKTCEGQVVLLYTWLVILCRNYGSLPSLSEPKDETPYTPVELSLTMTGFVSVRVHAPAMAPRTRKDGAAFIITKSENALKTMLKLMFPGPGKKKAGTPMWKKDSEGNWCQTNPGVNPEVNPEVNQVSIPWSEVKKMIKLPVLDVGNAGYGPKTAFHCSYCNLYFGNENDAMQHKDDLYSGVPCWKYKEGLDYGTKSD